MAKLYAELSSDKSGRKVSKGGDEEITVQFSNGNLNIFEITFKSDLDKRGKISVMSYFDGEKQIINYDPIPF